MKDTTPRLNDGALTLLQYYAGLAMQGMLPVEGLHRVGLQKIATLAIDLAETLIAELQKRESEAKP